MLYLAEVKKQTRGFIGGIKTELKLLACQHNDQSWSAVPADEAIVCEESNIWGEGALVMITLGNNRQIQGSPETATPELIRQLQKISRLMEKVKDEQEKIEQWKQSLTYQSQELTRREMEIEARLEQVDQMESEFEYLERQRKELDQSWADLHAEQERLEQGQIQLGPLSNLSPEQASSLQAFIHRLSDSLDGLPSLTHSVQQATTSVTSAQTALDSYWQRLEQHQKILPQKQQEVTLLRETVELRQQELESTHSSIEQAKNQVQIQEAVLHGKKDRLGRLNFNIETTEEIRESLSRLVRGIDDPELEQKIDFNALEMMPLGELEEIINKLQKDLDKLVLFVNDQEEELTLQSQAVDELEAKLQSASEYDRISIENELAEEQERKGMLDGTLVGQRRNLKERQVILVEYSRVLRRRRGINDPVQDNGRMNLEPILIQLIEQQQSTEEERQRLEGEVEHLQKSLQPLKEMIAQQWSEYSHKAEAIKQQQQHLQQAQCELAKLQTQIQLMQEMLQPLQDHLSALRQNTGTLSHWIC